MSTRQVDRMEKAAAALAMAHLELLDRVADAEKGEKVARAARDKAEEMVVALGDALWAARCALAGGKPPEEDEVIAPDPKGALRIMRAACANYDRWVEKTQ